jgi:hypothetical protein
LGKGSNRFSFNIRRIELAIVLDGIDSSPKDEIMFAVISSSSIGAEHIKSAALLMASMDDVLLMLVTDAVQKSFNFSSMAKRTSGWRLSSELSTK